MNSPPPLNHSLHPHTPHHLHHRHLHYSDNGHHKLPTYSAHVVHIKELEAFEGKDIYGFCINILKPLWNNVIHCIRTLS